MNWIVLVGAPAVGKSTLSNQLSSHFNAKIYSFDREFPLKTFQEKAGAVDSKDCRAKLIEMALSSSTGRQQWIIVDDTCHLRSIQKRYLQTTVKFPSLNIKIVFLYLSARLDQISELQSRNSTRNSGIKDEEIVGMVRILNAHPPNRNFAGANVIEYNYTELPSIDDIARRIEDSLKCHTARKFVNDHEPDKKSNENIFNQLNLALSREITLAFKSKNSTLNGKEISSAKKAFLQEIRSRAGPLDLDSLTSEFKTKYLTSFI